MLPFWQLQLSMNICSNPLCAVGGTRPYPHVPGSSRGRGTHPSSFFPILTSSMSFKHSVNTSLIFSKQCSSGFSCFSFSLTFLQDGFTAFF